VGHKESCTPEVENLDLKDPETSISEDQNKKKPAKIQKLSRNPKQDRKSTGFLLLNHQQHAGNATTVGKLAAVLRIEINKLTGIDLLGLPH